MKKLQTLTTSTAIALASVGAPAFAQEAQATSVPADTAVNEPALVAKPQVKPLEKSEVPAPSTVKTALDAQKAVVKDAEAKIDTAEADVKTKEATVASTEKEVATATQAVKDAEAIASQVTPEKVDQVKEAQAKNVEAQTANQKATEATNEQIKAESNALAKEQSDVASAQANLEQANKDVQTAEQAVASAQSALDGTGLVNAENDLKDAQKGVKDAEATVNEAETAFATAKKADEAREDAIKSAETDVNTKNDDVKLAKEKLATANEHAESVEAKLQSAQAELKSAQAKLANTGVSKDIVKIGNPTFHISDSLRDRIGAKSNDITYKDAFDLWKKDGIVQIAHPDNEDIKRVMRGMAVEMSSASTIKISENDKNRPVDLNNLTDAQLIEISEFYAKMLTQLNHNFGHNLDKKAYVSQKTLEHSKLFAKKYEERALSPRTAGHIPGGLENLTTMGDKTIVKTMYDLKYATQCAFELSSFEDEPSKWGHLQMNLSNQANGPVALTVANINGEYWMLTTFADYDDGPIKKETNTAEIEKAVATAKSNLEQATTALENAKNALTKASTDYASALSLKTEAEKVLADAMATPLQAQVAENNLHLANIAFENAKKREAQASEAVANFSASLADKKATLEKAQDALKSAKVKRTIASQALENASAKLEDQETKLDNLNKQVTKLLAEKDALVKEAKKLAEELQAYLDAPVALANAQDAQAKAEAKLAQAKAELTKAQSTLEDLLTAQKAEEAKLAELEATYAKLVDLAEKAQENVVATLPDGTVIAVPKVAPTAETLPEVNIDELQKALATGKEVTLDAQGNVIVKGQTYTSQQQASSKPTYSRVERAKTLPNTGTKESNITLLVLAILSGFGLVSKKKDKENNIWDYLQIH